MIKTQLLVRQWQ